MLAQPSSYTRPPSLLVIAHAIISDDDKKRFSSGQVTADDTEHWHASYIDVNCISVAT